MERLTMMQPLPLDFSNLIVENFTSALPNDFIDSGYLASREPVLYNQSNSF